MERLDNYPKLESNSNLKDENYKMVFGVTKDDSVLYIGQGYISINDVIIPMGELPDSIR